MAKADTPVRFEIDLWHTSNEFQPGHRIALAIISSNFPRLSRNLNTEFEFLDEDDGRPFMAMISYGPPHPPLVMPEHYKTMYGEDEVPVRENSPDEGESRVFLAKYYGFVTAVDDVVGRVMDYLDEKGLSDNTIVYFVSDHGEMAGEHGLGGKRVIFEASMRVPLIVRWPDRVAGGRVVDALVDPSVDTMPTLLDLCGIAIPGSVQGTSFVSLLNGEAEVSGNESQRSSQGAVEGARTTVFGAYQAEDGRG
ncbi:MAG: sulfatase-like hydrolase/transferase [bacterium]|nr:sulfatase-like hydrolase/transferase [bacterium]